MGSGLPTKARKLLIFNPQHTMIRANITIIICSGLVKGRKKSGSSPKSCYWNKDGPEKKSSTNTHSVGK